MFSYDTHVTPSLLVPTQPNTLVHFISQHVGKVRRGVVLEGRTHPNCSINNMAAAAAAAAAERAVNAVLKGDHK